MYRCGVVGNAQHATATTLHGMRLGVLLVVSSTLSTHAAKDGAELLCMTTRMTATDRIWNSRNITRFVVVL